MVPSDPYLMYLAFRHFQDGCSCPWAITLNVYPIWFCIILLKPSFVSTFDPWGTSQLGYAIWGSQFMVLLGYINVFLLPSVCFETPETQWLRMAENLPLRGCMQPRRVSSCTSFTRWPFPCAPFTLHFVSVSGWFGHLVKCILIPNQRLVWTKDN